MKNDRDAVNAVLRHAVVEAGSLLIDTKTLLSAQIAEQQRIASELNKAVESAAWWLSKAQGANDQEDGGLIRSEYMTRHDECAHRARALEPELQRQTGEVNELRKALNIALGRISAAEKAMATVVSHRKQMAGEAAHGLKWHIDALNGICILAEQLITMAARLELHDRDGDDSPLE